MADPVGFSEEIYIPLTARLPVYYLGVPLNYTEFKRDMVDRYFDNATKNKLAQGKYAELNVKLWDSSSRQYKAMVLDFWRRGENLYCLGCREDDNQYHTVFVHPSKLSVGDWAAVSWNCDEKCLYIRIIHEHYYFKEPNLVGPPLNLQTLLDGTYYNSVDPEVRNSEILRKSWLVGDIENRAYSQLAEWDIIKYLGMVDCVDGLYVPFVTYLSKVPEDKRSVFMREVNSEQGSTVWIQDLDKKGIDAPYVEATVIRSATENGYVVIKFDREFHLTMGWIDGSVVGLKWHSYNYLAYGLVSHVKYWTNLPRPQQFLH